MRRALAPRPSPPRRPVLIAGLIAATAASSWLVLREPAPEPVEPLIVEAETPSASPARGVRPLVAAVPIPAGRSEPVDGLVLRADGSGEIEAAGTRVEMNWAVGTLDLEVEPAAGLAVAIHTPDGTVRVIGTGLQVRRSALGTEVTVRHGIVAVACEGAMPTEVHAGGSRMCLPTTPASFLGRARALETAGAPPLEVRAAAERGLAGDVSPSVRGELEVVRIRSFLGEGRSVDALAAAGAYLDAGYVDRRREVLRVAVSLASVASDCAAIARWHAELADGTVPPRCGP